MRATILLAALLAGSPAGAGPPVLVFEGSVPIHDKATGFTEPSGLALSADGRFLWSVSDDSDRLFRLGLDGRLLPDPGIRLPVTGMEGIALSPDGARLLLACEDGTEVLEITLADRSIRRRPLAAMAGFDRVAALFAGGGNKGLEAIAIDPGTGRVLLLKEGAPRLLLVLSPGLDAILGHEVLTRAAGFASDAADDDDLDVSGMALDPRRGILWIVSDRGRAIFRHDPGTGRAEGAALMAPRKGRLRPVKNAEGVALDPAAGRLHVVTDDGSDSRLLTWRILPGD